MYLAENKLPSILHEKDTDISVKIFSVLSLLSEDEFFDILSFGLM